MWLCQDTTCSTSCVPAKHLLQTAPAPSPACKANTWLMQPGVVALALPWVLEPLWEARSGKTPELWSRETGVQDWEGSSCLPGTPGDTCSTACQCSALGWTWFPAHPCIPPLWGCPKRWGHGWELPLCWLVSVGMLQCCGETEAELIYREPQPAGLHCLLSHSKHSLQFPLVCFFFFPFSFSELLARSQRMG